MSNPIEDEILDDQSIVRELKELPGWRREGPALVKHYDLPSFMEAMFFVNRIAVAAEAMDHHPDIALSYRKLDLRVWTHKNNALTRADVELARKINEVADQDS